jgi:hypothetical protein
MTTITKCVYEGCDGDVRKSGGVLRSGIKLQRYQCRKCGRTFVSDETYTPARARTNNIVLKNGDEGNSNISERKAQLPAPKCDECGELMNRTYVYQKKKNSKSGAWIPIGWSCIQCQKIKFTLSTDTDSLHKDPEIPHKEIVPRDERFCAEVVSDGVESIPHTALEQLGDRKIVDKKTPAINRFCDAQYEVVGHAPITEEETERLKRVYGIKPK